MSTPIPLNAGPRMLLAAAVWALLIAGLVVMRGAGSHGTTAHASAPAAHMLGVMAAHSGHEGHDGVALNGDRVQDRENDGESPWHSGAELCLAILCSLLSALAFLALTRPKRHQYKVRRSVTALIPPWLRRPDPPCLTRLSILRC